jgi:hypothetical protein
MNVVTAVLRGIATAPGRGRLHRAASQYHIALRYWSAGEEILALAHLYIGMEVMTPLARERHLEHLGVDKVALAGMWSVTPRNLDSEIRKRLLFKEHDWIYERARKASDGFEHGYLSIPEIRDHAIASRNATAGLLRRAILDHLGLEPSIVSAATNRPFEQPIGLRTGKFVFGTLRGSLDALAAEDQHYPRFDWKSTISTVEADERIAVLGFRDTITARLGNGTTFTGGQYELWGS